MEKNKKNTYWKSIEEFKNPKPFKEAAMNEFPDSIMEAPSTMSRKKFLAIMGASIALAGLSGCRKPVQKILPYVEQPEGTIPGIPKYYATAMPFGLNAFGVIVENHEGRPTHIEGNKNHPSSLGATNAIVQASILDLYDPDRSKSIRSNGKRSSWKKVAEKLKTIDKKKTAILSHSFSSPSIYAAKEKLEKQGVSWYCYDPMSNENELAGIKRAYNKSSFANYSLDKVNRILSIDSDFLSQDENPIKNTKDFSKNRKVTNYKNAKMNRLYVVEGSLTTTGAMADHRKRLKQSEINEFVYELWNCFSNNGKSSDNFIKEVYKDLKSNKGLVKGGGRLSAECHELIVRMNHRLKSKGVRYATFSSTNAACPSDSIKYKKLIQDMKNGNIECLCILDSNPIYFSKSKDGFRDALKQVPTSIHFGSYYDETASECNWHIPKTHYLESWGDCQSLDGTISVIQPLISPLYNQSYADLDFLYLINDPHTIQDPIEKAYEVVKGKHKNQNWTRCLHNGIVRKAKHSYINKSPRTKEIQPKKASTGNEVVFYLSSQIYDGRFSNNAWLQEVPDSISKVTWDNVALLSQKTAKELKVKNKEILSLSYDGKTVKVPAWILPGHADGQISVQVGYGRTFESKVAKSVGSNVYPLMNGAQSNPSVKIKGTGVMTEIACTQDHHGMNVDDQFANNEVQNRLPDIYRELDLDKYKKEGGYKIKKIDKDKHLTMKDGDMKTLYDNPYEEYYNAKPKPYNKPYDPNDPPQWGMTIDLSSCTGCNACDIACQSENNIPTVGKDQVLKGREMSWIRTDRYFKGDDINNPDVAFQPVPCMHCENAPCEQVCPVAATVHDKEGLNAMVYNRCIGTRYCSNNCPYKVRRFNFHNNTYDTPEVVQMAHNPDVTIRFRGVMEKCTFCVQRIKEVEHKSKVQNKNLNDFNLKTACQSACPADCIEFGNIKDTTSDVYTAKQNDRDYSLLAQLNTRPRTTYLAKLRNPNKAISKS